MGEKRRVTRVNVVATIVRPSLALSAGAGAIADWLLLGEVGVVTASLATIGLIGGLILGLLVLARLEAAGHRFPKMIEDGVPWTVDEPPSEQELSHH
jgi:hypothetical protein